MTLSGASAARGSGVTRATAAAAPATWPAPGPDRRERPQPLAVPHDDERPALLVLGAVGAAARRRGCGRGRAGSSGRSANSRTARLRADGVPDGHRVARSGIGGGGSVAGGGCGWPASAAPVAPDDAGQRAEAAGLLVERRQALGIREADGRDGRGERRGLVGSQRAAEGRREEPGDRRAVARGTRRATSAGRPRRPSSRSRRPAGRARRAAASRARSPDGHDAVVAAVDEHDRDGDLPDRPAWR